ncbi:hypothetical protein [Streptomyces sp. NPDC050504]|uniref:hypothetical protein n=1 Tax=Streptomyces sp. NPDC050504 TaxID=3365618 RepID=UPI0037887F92
MPRTWWGGRATARPGLRRFAHAVALVVTALSVTLLTLAGTADSTVLNRAYYQSVLDEEDAYERLYDQVLVDPQAARVTRDLLGRVPVPQSLITANLRTVLPPATLRTLVDEQIGHGLDYLRGRDDRLGVSVDLTPVLTNIGSVAQIYLGDLVATAQGRQSADFPAFMGQLSGALGDIAAGRRPVALPELKLGAATARKATDLLVGALPESVGPALRPQVSAALASGDTATALAAVGPYLIGDKAPEARRELAGITDNGQWRIVPDLEAEGVDLGPVKAARAFTHLGLEVMRGAALAAGLVAIGLFLWKGPPGWARRLRALGLALAAGGLLAGLVVLLAYGQLGDLVREPPASWPPSLAELTDDVQHRAAGSLLSVGLLTAAAPLTAGLLLAAGAHLWPRVAASPAGARVALVRAVAAAAALVVAGAVAGAVFVPRAAGKGAGDLCLGSAALCERRYDEVAYLATHNAMSTTEDRYIGPLQDPGITAQLNAGARALLIDTYTWETPEEAVERLRIAEFAPGLKEQIRALSEAANPPRPGLWLCHGVCRAGATPLVPALREIGAWLEENRGDVVTLIVQDAITGEQTAGAFREAGLERYLMTPQADPAKPWPKLGDMIRDNHRLVVFAEQADGPAPWYRNFYAYGMETPFAFRKPAEMSCVPHRGGTGKRLFLLNHFITRDGGSRLDAGEVNARAYVLDRAARCERERGRPVNFVAVDYATIGDAKGAVDALNNARRKGGDK